MHLCLDKAHTDKYTFFLFLSRTPLHTTQMEGNRGQDIVHLTADLFVEHQAFVQIFHTTPEKDDDCFGWDGTLGLGPTVEGITPDDIVEEGFPTLRANLQKILRYPMFSLYLDDTDDYPENIATDSAKSPEIFDSNGDDDGLDRIPNVVPTVASSELVLGGIKSAHYSGCLNWHDLHPYKLARDYDVSNDDDDGNAQGGSTNSTSKSEDLVWNVKLDAVKAGGVSLLLPAASGDGTMVAILVSDATLSIGNAAAVGQYAALNEMTCLLYEKVDEFLIEQNLAHTTTETPCDDGYFDLAYIDCTADVIPLDFLIDGVTYSIGKESLLTPADSDILGANVVGDNWCLFTVLPMPDVPGWMLGEGFLRLYYAAFDFGRYKIGLAPRAKNDPNVCPADAYLDVANQDQPAPTSVDSPTSSPVATGTAADSPSFSPVSDPNRYDPPPAPPPAPNPSDFLPFSAVNDDTSNSSSAGAPPGGFLVAAVVVGMVVLALLIWRRRRAARYHRASYFDDNAFRMGDMELSVID
jgi:hypothetical protein